MTRILFYLDGYPHDVWRDALLKIDPMIEFIGNPDWPEPDDIGDVDGEDTYAFVWEAPDDLLAKYKNIKAIFSLGAGVDHLLRDPNVPTDKPIIRMGDDGLKEGMVEFVVMSVLMHHRGMPKLIDAQRNKKWGRIFAPAAENVSVGIMGYGALGKVCATALKPLGYKINAWSRSPKDNEDSVVHYTGLDNLDAFLSESQIIVGLLPNTEATSGLLNKARMEKLPKGASIINAGRGSLIIIEDLIELLDNDHLSGAILDVFVEEPIGADHPAWDHSKIVVTPHIAAVTRPDSAAEYVIRNIKRMRDGRAPENVLILDRGY